MDQEAFQQFLKNKSQVELRQARLSLLQVSDQGKEK